MIKNAAIFKNGKLFTGTDHSVCLKDCMLKMDEEPIITEYGFVTDTGEFLSRSDAALHAWKCGQTERLLKTLNSYNLTIGYSD